MQLDTSPNLSLESLTHLLEKNITVHFECRALLSECPTQVTSASLEKCMFLRWLPHSSGFTYEDPIHVHLTMWSHVPQAYCNWQQLSWSLSYSLLKHDSNHLLHISRDMPIILCFFFCSLPWLLSLAFSSESHVFTHAFICLGWHFPSNCPWLSFMVKHINVFSNCKDPDPNQPLYFTRGNDSLSLSPLCLCSSCHAFPLYSHYAFLILHLSFSAEIPFIIERGSCLSSCMN